MARIRSIKPEFWSSEQITECSMNARLMFIGMWNFSDDAGRKVASTKRLKMEVFPGDAVRDSDIRKWMDELVSHGLVMEYESQGQRYWQVTGWKHQKIQHPQASAIPDPFSECSVNIPVPVTPEGNGRELNGRDSNTSTRKRVVAYTDDFEAWWNEYPRKVQKGAAAKAYSRAIARVNVAQLMEATRAFAASDKAHGEFCPYPATWLNEDRWTDDRSQWSTPHSKSPGDDDLAEAFRLRDEKRRQREQEDQASERT